MNQKFSERFGFTQPSQDLGVEGMTPGLQNGLWDSCRICFFPDQTDPNVNYASVFHPGFKQLVAKVWFSYFRESLDDVPREPSEAYNRIKNYFFGAPFYKKYDFIEFLIYTAPERAVAKFCPMANSVFERERAAFRFVDGILVQTADQQEQSELSESFASANTGVREHIRRSAELYSDRTSPDYRNSIKEAVSAVEAAVRHVSGTKEVGVSRALRPLLEELDLHPALIAGFDKLYAYTSDDSGIRHAMLEKDSLRQEDAKYMLVSCASFSNYLLKKFSDGRLTPGV